MDILHLDSSRPFDTASCKIFIEELLIQGMDERTARWIENWPGREAGYQ